MEVNEKKSNLAELVTEISIFKRDQEQLNIIIGFQVTIWICSVVPERFSRRDLTGQLTHETPAVPNTSWTKWGIVLLRTL